MKLWNWASRGFDVTAIDFAKTPVERLQSELANRGYSAEILVTDALGFQPERTFDAVYEQTFLCAIHPALRSAYATRLAHWLKPGGQLFALFMQCEAIEQGPPFHCDLEEMRSLFPAPTWRWLDAPAKRVDHPSGLHELATILTRT